METGIVAIVAAAIGAAVGAIIEQLGGWANDHIKLRRAKIQNKIAEEQAKANIQGQSPPPGADR